MQHLNTQISAHHTVATVTPPRPSHTPLQHHLPAPRRTRATSWWGMTLLVAGLPGGWVVMGVGCGVFLGLIVGLWLWAGVIDKKGGSV